MPDRRPRHDSATPQSRAELSKTCAACGRTMTWRKAWARTWDEVRWCSDTCRRRGVSAEDHAAEAVLEQHLRSLPRGRPLMLDEVAVADTSPVERERWRSAARRIAARGEAEMVVDGRVVDPSHARGDRVGLRRRA